MSTPVFRTLITASFVATGLITAVHLITPALADDEPNGGGYSVPSADVGDVSGNTQGQEASSTSGAEPTPEGQAASNTNGAEPNPQGQVASATGGGEAAPQAPGATEAQVKEDIETFNKQTEDLNKTAEELKNKPMTQEEIKDAIEKAEKGKNADEEVLKPLHKGDPRYEDAQKVIKAEENAIQVLKSKEPATAEAIEARNKTESENHTKLAEINNKLAEEYKNTPMTKEEIDAKIKDRESAIENNKAFLDKLGKDDSRVESVQKLIDSQENQIQALKNKTSSNP